MKPLSPQHPSCGSNGRSTAGCISRILRRILCFTNLPLCPFDHFNEHEQDVVGASGPTPGLVARLMGLESVPRIEPIEESPSVSLFKKSRSDEQVSRQKFLPPYQELEDENFFILSFERKKSGKKQRRKTECLQGKESNKENEEINRGHFQFDNAGINLLLPVNNSYEQSEKRRMKKTNRENEEGETENSSPNSVLEFVGFTTDQESASPGEVSRLANSKMRRPLSDELEKEAINNGDGEMDIRVRNIQQNYAEKWDEIGEMAAMETMKSRWLDHEMSKNGECLMEISRDVESSILDLLLDELLFSFSVN